jgi:hypothetical protein
MQKEMTVETALRTLRNQGAMLSWLMQLSNGEDPVAEALDGISDTCDGMADLAQWVMDTLDTKAKNTRLADDYDDGDDDDEDEEDGDDDEPDSTALTAKQLAEVRKYTRRMKKHVDEMLSAVKKLKSYAD